MAYADYQLIRITVDRGICRATLDHSSPVAAERSGCRGSSVVGAPSK